MTNKQPSMIGGACIIASVCVGAGMLGLPSSGAGAWTLWSLLALIVTMVMMTLSGWMLLEAFRGYDLRASFHTVTRDLLGSKINWLSNLSVYFVGGILLYAYITSSGLILEGALGISRHLASIGFVLVFSLVVWHSTRAVDRISILLILFMVLSFVFGVSGLAININPTTLFDLQDPAPEYWPYLMGMFPVALVSFGFHHSVSSMRAYYGDENKAKWAIALGTLIALSFYVLWIFSIFGNLSRQDFVPVLAQGGNIEALLAALDSVIESKRVAEMINAFSMAALLSSFIGVGLGVFDYLADLFKLENSRSGRTITGLITFLPPLVLSLIYPFGFLAVIGYAGAIATIWTCIIPALLVKRARRDRRSDGSFVVPGGNFLIYLLLIFGVLTALFHFMSMLEWLPAFPAKS